MKAKTLSLVMLVATVAMSTVPTVPAWANNPLGNPAEAHKKSESRHTDEVKETKDGMPPIVISYEDDGVYVYSVRTGEEIKAFREYHSLVINTFGSYVGAVSARTKDGEWITLDFTGEPLTRPYATAEEYYAADATSRDKNTSAPDRLKIAEGKDGKVGFADAEGNIVIPCIWHDARGGFAATEPNAFDDYCVVSTEVYSSVTNPFSKDEKKYKYGLINKKGTEIIPCMYDDLDLPSNSDGKYIIATNSQGTGIIDLESREIEPFIYSEVEIDGDLAILRRREDSFTGVKSLKTGSMIIPFEKSVACDFADYFGKKVIYKTRYVARGNEPLSVYDLNGEIIVAEWTWDRIYRSCGNNNYMTVEKNDRCGLLHSDGVLVVPCRYLEMGHVGSWDDRIMVQNSAGYYGIIDLKGTEIIPCRARELLYDENI